MDTQSENVKNIASALRKVQSDIRNPKKDALNPFFKSKYLKLPTLLDIAREYLIPYEITFLQLSESIDGVNYMVTLFIHESGEWIKSYYPVLSKDPSDPQKLGSAISYARRYSLQALLGVCGSDEDDDGNKASDDRISAETCATMDDFLNGHHDIRKMLLHSCGVTKLQDIKNSQLSVARKLVKEQIAAKKRNSNDTATD